MTGPKVLVTILVPSPALACAERKKPQPVTQFLQPDRAHDTMLLVTSCGRPRESTR